MSETEAGTAHRCPHKPRKLPNYNGFEQSIAIVTYFDGRNIDSIDVSVHKLKKSIYHGPFTLFASNSPRAGASPPNQTSSNAFPSLILPAFPSQLNQLTLFMLSTASRTRRAIPPLAGSIALLQGLGYELPSEREKRLQNMEESEEEKMLDLLIPLADLEGEVYEVR